MSVKLPDALEKILAGVKAKLDDTTFTFAVNDEVVTHGRDAHPVKSGDRIEVMPIFSGD